MQRRSLRRLLCRLFAGMLLLTQLAVAAHACPMAVASHAAMAMEHGSAPCDAMPAPCGEPPSPLCATHCQPEAQSDSSSDMSMPAAVPAGDYPVPVSPAPVSSARPRALRAAAIAVAPPPHAILHCCFRI